MQNVWLKSGISVVAVLLIAARLIWPDLKIDVISIGLFILALVPWLTSIVESMKFPGGWEIKLRDLAEAGKKVTDANPITESVKLPKFMSVTDQDPNLALVALRIEVEHRLRALAEKYSIPSQRSLSRLFHELRKREVFDHAAFSGLHEIIMAGNQAAHGATVEPTLADWAFSNGSAILSSLDAKLEDD
ncbi:MAG: DUF4145 domain-containing protein [Deltaproteobacteria bacterium]|nr:DUF4145 domain-containing protein [Deltaproteobacteria bacterium]